MAVRVARKFFELNPKEDGEGGDVGGSILWPARVDAWVATVLSCLTDWKTCGVLW